MNVITRTPAANFRLTVVYEDGRGQTVERTFTLPFHAEPTASQVKTRARAIVADLTGRALGRNFISYDAVRL